MPLIYLVQHGEKHRVAGDPGLTERGRAQATRTGWWLRRAGLGALYRSPLRRTRQTAQLIATAAGLDVQQDARLRERMNWDGSQPIEDFLTDWARSVRDRDFVPRTGDSSRRAGQRLQAFLAERANEPAPLAVVTHGGVTVDLVRHAPGRPGPAGNPAARGRPLLRGHHAQRPGGDRRGVDRTPLLAGSCD